MPAEPGPVLRLHPASFLFALLGALRGLLGPAVLLAFVAGGTERWGWLLAVYLPAAAAALVGALARQLSFRYELRADELWIQHGILSRRERHIPYARIQNLDLVQGPLHRLLAVADLRIETASGDEAEADIRVLGLDRIDAIRAALGRDRHPSILGASGDAAGAARPEGEAIQQVLDVPAGHLALLGMGSGRGLALALAGIGLAWELAWQLDLLEPLDPERAFDRARALGGAGRMLSPATTALLLVALLGIGLLLAALSAAWSLWRYHGFLLERQGEELRLRYGLITRYSATIPRRRIQSLAVTDSPLLRRLGLCQVSVETAGAVRDAREAGGRSWLAPVLPRQRLEQVLLAAGLAELEHIEPADWHGAHPRAAARLGRRRLLALLAIGLPLIGLAGQHRPVLAPAATATLSILAALAWLTARWEARRLGYALGPSALVLRRGWWTRSLTLTPYDKLQALALTESPFDRRHGMAALAFDTAGRGRGAHRLLLPLLDRDGARALQQRMAAEAARTIFRW